MANDKIYPIDMNSKDILLQNEGGGGMIMNDQFIGIVGNMLPDQKQLLDDQEYAGGTNIQTDKFSSNIIITNASSNPVGMNDLASKNFDSLDQSIGTNQVVAATPKDHCGGENLLNYEWQEISKNILSWYQLHSTTKAKGRPTVPFMYKPKNGVLESKYYNDYLKSEDQLKTFLFDQPMTDIIKSVYTLNNSGFPNYNSVSEDNWTISKDITDDYSKTWIHIEDTSAASLGMVKNKLKYFKNNNGVNKFESRSVFDIQVLPSGLRSFIYGALYYSIDRYDWHELLLVTIGPDYLNILTGLGLTKAQAFDDNLNSGSSKKFKKASTASETQEKFFKEYEDIINTYNQDKTKFLNTLYKVFQEYFESYTKFQLTPPASYSQWYLENIFLPYFKVQRNMSLAIALKYADCPDEYELAGNVPTAPTPSPSVTVTAPPTVAETNEDLYATELLPASEDETFRVFEDEEYTSNKIVLDALADGTTTIVKINPNVPPASTYNPSVKVDMDEISQWVDMEKDVKSDWEKGWTYAPYGAIGINPYLLQSLASACKATGIKATITVSKTNHREKSKGGKISRHWKGTGVDVGVLNGIRGNNKQYAADNINNMVPEFRRLGTILYNQLVADGHTGDERLLGTDNQYEAGQDKSVLFMTQIGGNHYNHLHVGNRILSAPGVKPKIIRE